MASRKPGEGCAVCRVQVYHASGHWPPRCCGAMAAQICPCQIGLAPLLPRSSLHQTRLDLGGQPCLDHRLLQRCVESLLVLNTPSHLTLCRSCTINMGTDNAAQHAATHDSHNVGGGFEGASSILVAFSKLGPILRYQLGYTSRPLSRDLIQESKKSPG